MPQLIIIVLILAFPSSVFAAYKCTDTNGRVGYQDQPCAEGAVEKEIRLYSPPEQGVSNGAFKPKVSADPAVSDGDVSGDKMSFVDESSMLLRTHLAGVLSSLSPIKIRVIEYYYNTGVWPQKLKDIDLDKDEMTSREINTIVLGDEGGIYAYLDEQFGEDKKVVLMPKRVMGGTSVEWECFANFSVKRLAYRGRALCESRAIN